MSFRVICRSFGKAIGAGIVALIFTSAPAQNIFVSDHTNVYEFTPGGLQRTFASGFGSAAGLAFNSAGDLFVADEFAGNVYKFTPDGTQTIFASGMSQPTGLAFNSAGDLFVGDQNNGCIYEVTPDGTRSTFASGLVSPEGLAFNGAGDLFEADWVSTKIYEFTTNGTQTTFASEGNFADPVVAPFALAFATNGNLFVGNDVTTHDYIAVFTPDGVGTTFVASGLTTACGLAFNSAGDLFEADQGSGNIYEFTPDGARSTFASGLMNPVAIAIQPAPQLQAVTTNGSFQVVVSEPSPYFAAIIQTSTNLINWVSVYTNTPPYTFTDAIAPTQSHFYRALLSR